MLHLKTCQYKQSGEPSLQGSTASLRGATLEELRLKSSQPRRVRTPTRNVLHLSARQPKPSITPSLRGAALEIKRCRSFGLPTPPLASSPQLTRATRLPALTGKSMSNLRGSLRRSRMPSGARTAPHALGYRPARTTSPPSQLGRGSEKIKLS